jgi:hypothetical protein
VLLHFGTQSETADFSEDGSGGSGFPVMPKLNQRMDKVNAHKSAKESKEQQQQQPPPPHQKGQHK